MNWEGPINLWCTRHAPPDGKAAVSNLEAGAATTRVQFTSMLAFTTTISHSMLYNLSHMRSLAGALLISVVLLVAPALGQSSSAHFPSAGEIFLAQNSPPPSNPGSSHKPEGNTPNSPSVRITEFPPVSMNKDWSDWAYWVFTLFLVAVGGLQVFLLWGNLRAIERQALQMERQSGILEKSVASAEKSAETAKQSVDMFVSRERGHLRVELLPLESPLRPGPINVRYKVMLYGATEAYISSSCARVEITDSPEAGDDGQWWPAMSVPQVITPDARIQEAPVQGVFPKATLEQSDVDAIEAGKKFIHFRGFVKYNDVFGAERWTRCRRMWELSILRNPDGTRSGHWSKRGGAKDNSET